VDAESSQSPSARAAAADRPRTVARVESWSVDPADFGALLAAARSCGGIAALDSAGGAPCQWSLLAFDPLERAEGLTALEQLRAPCARLPELPAELPFAGGFVGAVAYDLGPAGEGLRLPQDPWGSPHVAGGFYTDALWLDLRRGTVQAQVVEVEQDPRGPAAARAARLRRALAAPPPSAPCLARGPLQRHTSDAEHCARIEQVRARIRRGEVYQVNLTHRLTRAVEGDPLTLYLRLRASNPAPYAGYLEWPGGALLCSSPEVLLDYDGVEARTRPIKGTAARGADAGSDRAAAEALLRSAKDRAELAMIVDLERNDLGRLARPGAVTVDRFPELESYAAVHHLVATVRARPRAGIDAVALLEALFPGGSISGAPKLTALAAIAELEGQGRGFYTGTLGLLDRRGRCSANILIRTLQWRARPELGPAAGEVALGVGGGITYDSDPRAEVRETEAKARALLAALEGGRT
jgi:para-aminobenzoate synthetase component 1